jgi:hypothetical protein
MDLGFPENQGLGDGPNGDEFRVQGVVEFRECPNGHINLGLKQNHDLRSAQMKMS